MTQHYVLSAADRKAIADQFSKARSAPPRPNIAADPAKPNASPPTYWGLPPCETGLPAAEYVGGELRSYGVLCCLYKHDSITNQMTKMLDPVGMPIRVKVFNYYTESTNALTQIHQHKDGSWSNEKPGSTPGSVVTPLPDVVTTPGVTIPVCQGECKWESDVDGVWQWPTGACADRAATTTSTTTTTTGTTTTGTTGTTTTGTTTSTTAAPCTTVRCKLKCLNTGTTTVPGVAYSGYRYDAIEACDGDCDCYGDGDPCFLLNGEVYSKCLGTTVTTTSTTLGPSVTACDLAEIYSGPLIADVARDATMVGVTAWENCQECSPSDWRIWVRGANGYSNVTGRDSIAVSESPCVGAPCYGLAELTPNKAIFRAFKYDQQVAAFGDSYNIVSYDASSNKYVANWQLCAACPSGYRPAQAPPFTLHADDALNVGVESEDGVWSFVADCVAGFPCDACGNAPLFTNGGDTPGGTTATTTSTTTPNPSSQVCGCDRPNYCPEPFECIRTSCRKGGEVVAGAPTGDAPAYLYCFPDSTTTGTTTTQTTTHPSQCIGRDGMICNCTTTTAAPITCGTCQGSLGGTIEESCGQGCYCPVAGWSCTPVDCEPYPTTTPRVPIQCEGCVGSCSWTWLTFTETGVAGWSYAGGSCGCANGFDEVPVFGRCECPTPAGEGTVCGDVVYTQCVEASSNGTTVSPPSRCDCCTTDDCHKVCRWRGSALEDGTWESLSNPCPTTCPCPTPNFDSVDDCDVITYRCGQTLPPVTTTLAPIRPCCIPPGARGPTDLGGCFQMTRNQCLANNGYSATDNTQTCGNFCPYMRCCYRGFCEQMTSDACTANSGTELGYGSCDFALPFGGCPTRCCVTYEAEGSPGDPGLTDCIYPYNCTDCANLASAAGIWGTECKAGDCTGACPDAATSTTATTTTQAPGPCCVGSWCGVLAEAFCTSLSGTWYGPGGTCPGGLCPDGGTTTIAP